LSVPKSLNNLGLDYAQSIAKEFRHVVSNREHEEWDHLGAEPEQGGQGRLVRAVMKCERHHGKCDVPKTEERYDCEGDECDDVIDAECIYDESGKEEQDGDEQEGRQRFDKRRDPEPVSAERKILSDVCADMGWMIPLSKLKIPASPLLQKGSHESAGETQHEADNPNSVHEYGRSGRFEGIRIDECSCSRIWQSRKLLGYLGKEGLSNGIGVLL